MLPLLLAAFSLSASACYSERLPPPTFRHSCGGDGECGEGESCVSGLCQVPCTLATSLEDCGQPGQGSSYFGCLNGVCSSLCDPGNDICPGEQSCATIPGEDESLGVCIAECTEDSCPDGEICIEGFCAQACDPTDPMSCGDGETCLLGVCVPDDVVETAGEVGTAEGGDTDEGDTDGNSEGGATE